MDNEFFPFWMLTFEASKFLENLTKLHKNVENLIFKKIFVIFGVFGIARKFQKILLKHIAWCLQNQVKFLGIFARKKCFHGFVAKKSWKISRLPVLEL